MPKTIKRTDCEDAGIATRVERAAETVGAPEGHRLRSVEHDHVWTSPNHFGPRGYRCCQVCNRVQETHHPIENRARLSGEEGWKDAD